jgi:hypothetical protein
MGEGRMIKRHLLIFAAVLAIYAALYWLGIACPIRALTGIPCPTCGMLRAFRELFAGNIRKSLEYNAAALPTAALVLFGIHKSHFKIRENVKTWILIAGSGMIFIYYIIRLAFFEIP